MRQARGRRPRTNEAAFNFELARQLRARHPRWREEETELDAIAAEQTGALNGKAARRRRPDIVIRHPGGLPVVVETEFTPARTVEADAEARLGETVGGFQVEGVLAVRVPNRLAGLQTRLGEAINRESFEFCLLSKNHLLTDRWPQSGWLTGGIDKLAEAIEHAALSETRLAEAADHLEDGIRNGTSLLREHLQLRPDIFPQMAEILHQEDGRQTSRMAIAIIANAFVFQHAISGNHDISEPEKLRNKFGMILVWDVVDCWRKALEINYWPIFHLALRLLREIPEAVATPILDVLVKLSTQLSKLGTASLHDLSGQMFQRLISDRKFLATFYTLPTSAALLAELAVRRLHVDWSDPEVVGHLKIADFACGTGSLLAAARQSVARRHRQAGGDDLSLHAQILEEVLIATDIMPAATHLTASTLSSAHPREPFSRTNIFTMPYGEVEGRICIGSLDLTLEDQVMSLFGDNEATRVGGKGEEESQFAVVERGTCDLVIMNPPFTNPTNHEATDVPVPSFAGFGTAEDEQAAMSEQLKKIRSTLVKHSCPEVNGDEIGVYPAGNGNAGLASNFIDLAHAKLREGGCLALVLPASFANGAAWKDARNLLATSYSQVTIVGIADDGTTERAFSADTGMAEVLVIAIKSSRGSKNEENRLVANLRRRPRTIIEGSLTAEVIDEARDSDARSGTLSLGNGTPGIGSFILTSATTAGNVVGIRELELAESVISLHDNRLNLPRLGSPTHLPMTQLSELGRRGVVDRDINGAPPRGPFDIIPLQADEYPQYPALWRHDASREISLMVVPDRRGRVRRGCTERAVELWQRTASRLHINRDFQLNSQPLAACITENPSLGGSAWPNFVLSDPAWESAVLLWANSTIGLMAFWWHGTRQQSGRSRVTISRLPELLMLDVRQLNAEQLARCAELVAEFSQREFLPANEAWHDEVRKDLDEALLTGVLGFGDDVINGLAVLREQWCREPSVHGGKSTRPPLN